MLSLKNTFAEDREVLLDQYINAWRCDEVFARHDTLTDEMLAYADSLSALPHPVIRAKCFAYLLEHSPIYINPKDWFGIALEVTKMDPILDTGSPYHRPLLELNARWKQELDDVLTSPEDKEFISHTRGYLFNELYIDYNHSTPCWEDIFSLGLSGILRRAREYRKSFGDLTEAQTAYFDGIEIAYDAFLGLLHRYAEELKKYSEPRMQYMRRAIENLTKNPPSNTYEALLLAWIYWFVGEQVEGIRVRTMGALDRLYRPFYEKDLASGLFSREDMLEMFTYFMSAFHALRVYYQEPMYLGGVDEDGKCVVSEISYLWLEAYNRLSAPNPKLQAIISQNTPNAFLLTVLKTIREGNSSISIINHELAEQALLKFGATPEEARTYLMSGCWDYAVRNHEVKTVPIRVSLPKILEYTMTGGVCLATGASVGIASSHEPKTFEDFLLAYKAQWLHIQGRAMRIVENWELHLAEISPSNLFSGTMTDSLSRALDGYARGMKYNNTVYTICGLATLVDSLCAIKRLVYDEKRFTLEEYVEILKSNWVGYESLRREILCDRDKYGNGSSLADALCVELLDFFSEHTNRRPNSRGSFWKLGILSIDKHVRFGALMDATPDGRVRGEPLSKNLSPVIGMDRGGVTTLLSSVSKMDFSNCPHSGILDLILHPSAVSGDDGLVAFSALVRTYFSKGGHSIQFNIFSADTLIEAQRSPEKYKNLQIRVCGWNVYFVDLEKPLQDAFIKEALHQEGRDEFVLQP